MVFTKRNLNSPPAKPRPLVRTIDKHSHNLISKDKPPLENTPILKRKPGRPKVKKDEDKIIDDNKISPILANHRNVIVKLPDNLKSTVVNTKFAKTNAIYKETSDKSRIKAIGAPRKSEISERVKHHSDREFYVAPSERIHNSRNKHSNYERIRSNNLNTPKSKSKAIYDKVNKPDNELLLARKNKKDSNQESSPLNPLTPISSRKRGRPKSLSETPPLNRKINTMENKVDQSNSYNTRKTRTIISPVENINKKTSCKDSNTSKTNSPKESITYFGRTVEKKKEKSNHDKKSIEDHKIKNIPRKFKLSSNTIKYVKSRISPKKVPPNRDNLPSSSIIKKNKHIQNNSPSTKNDTSKQNTFKSPVSVVKGKLNTPTSDKSSPSIQAKCTLNTKSKIITRGKIQFEHSKHNTRYKDIPTALNLKIKRKSSIGNKKMSNMCLPGKRRRISSNNDKPTESGEFNSTDIRYHKSTKRRKYDHNGDHLDLKLSDKRLKINRKNKSPNSNQKELTDSELINDKNTKKQTSKSNERGTEKNTVSNTNTVIIFLINYFNIE